MRLGFKEPATGVMEGIIELHNHILVFMVIIIIVVLWGLFTIKYNFTQEYRDVNFLAITHGQALEVIWTIIPAIILFFIAVPSFALLYMMEEGVSPKLTLKILGNQWYWNYEYMRILGVEKNFDSYMLVDDSITMGSLRLLEVDNPIVLPERMAIRLLVSSVDVLHSWAIPEFGIKIDAVPGRLNQVMLYINRLGIFVGQCSELCGVNHGMMPIVVYVVDLETFLLWLILGNKD